MSYRCQICRQHGEGSPSRAVAEREPIYHRQREDRAGKTIVDRGGSGTRIVREVVGHLGCVSKVAAKPEAVVTEAGPLAVSIGDLITEAPGDDDMTLEDARRIVGLANGAAS